jgi:prostaglandin-endoperoxide synthase 2
MAIEFNLPYRWHGLIPTELQVAGTDEPIWRTVFNPKRVAEHGLARLVDDASRRRAGRIGLRNTAPALREVEHNSILQGRA